MEILHRLKNSRISLFVRRVITGAATFDKDLINQSKLNSKDKDIYSIPCKPFDLYGVQYSKKEGRFFRIEQDKAILINSGVEYLSKNTAGGRLRFSTDSTTIGIKVEYNKLDAYTHMSLEGSCGFILKREIEGRKELIKHFTPQYNNKTGFFSEVEMKVKGMQNYILYFPNYNTVKSLSVVLNNKSKVDGGLKYKNIMPILYYGSSITQGGCASRADNCYQAYISEWNNINYINMGFSGSARAEQPMVEYLSKINCSLFVCDYDHNAINVNQLKDTHFNLYKRFRENQKQTPIIFMSRPDFYPDDDSFERKKIIKETYIKAKNLGDDNVYFIDGQQLFDDKDRDHCTVDKVHPNDLGFYRIAKKLYNEMKKIDKIFE